MAEQIGSFEVRLLAEISGFSRSMRTAEGDVTRVRRASESLSRDTGRHFSQTSRNAEQMRQQVVSSTREMERGFQTVTSSIRKFSSTFYRLASFAGVGFVGVQMFGALRHALVGYNEELVRSEHLLRHWAGTNTSSLIDTLRGMQQPFGFGANVQTAQTLLQYGTSPGQVERRLSILTDAVAGKGGGAGLMRSLAYSLGSLEQTGDTYGLSHLSRLGLPVHQYLADLSGGDFEETQRRMRSGDIGGNEAAAAIYSGLERDFGGLAEEHSRTLYGSVNRFGRFIRESVSKATEPAYDDLSRLSSRFADYLSSDEVTAGIEVFGETMANVFDAVESRVRSLAAAWGPAFMKVGQSVQNVGSTLIEPIGVAVEAAHGGLTLLGEAAGALATPLRVATEFAETFSAAIGLIGGAVLLRRFATKNAAMKSLTASVKSFAASTVAATKAATSMSTGFGKVTAATRAAAAGLKSMASSALSSVAAFAKAHAGFIAFTAAVGLAAKLWGDYQARQEEARQAVERFNASLRVQGELLAKNREATLAGEAAAAVPSAEKVLLDSLNLDEPRYSGGRTAREMYYQLTGFEFDGIDSLVNFQDKQQLLTETRLSRYAQRYNLNETDWRLIAGAFSGDPSEQSTFAIARQQRELGHSEFTRHFEGFENIRKDFAQLENLSNDFAQAMKQTAETLISILTSSGVDKVSILMGLDSFGLPDSMSSEEQLSMIVDAADGDLATLARSISIFLDAVNAASDENNRRAREGAAYAAEITKAWQDHALATQTLANSEHQLTVSRASAMGTIAGMIGLYNQLASLTSLGLSASSVSFYRTLAPNLSQVESRLGAGASLEQVTPELFAGQQRAFQHGVETYGTVEAGEYFAGGFLSKVMTSIRDVYGDDTVQQFLRGEFGSVSAAGVTPFDLVKRFYAGSPENLVDAEQIASTRYGDVPYSDVDVERIEEALKSQIVGDETVLRDTFGQLWDEFEMTADPVRNLGGAARSTAASLEQLDRTVLRLADGIIRLNDAGVQEWVPDEIVGQRRVGNSVLTSLARHATGSSDTSYTGGPVRGDGASQPPIGS